MENKVDNRVTMWFSEAKALKSGKTVPAMFKANVGLTIDQYKYFQNNIECGGSFIGYPVYSKADRTKLIAVRFDLLSKLSVDKDLEYRAKAKAYKEKMQANVSPVADL